MFYRQVNIPGTVPGHLYASAMLGRNGDFIENRDAILAGGIDTVLNLVPLEEIQIESPDYSAAILLGQIPWTHWHLPIPDFGVLEDREEFMQMVRKAAEHLQGGGS